MREEVEEPYRVGQLLVVLLDESYHHFEDLLEFFEGEVDRKALFLGSQEAAELLRMENVDESLVDVLLHVIGGSSVALCRVFDLDVDKAAGYLYLTDILFLVVVFDAEVEAELPFE